jgi:pimeloyl-ACP methyl ester carboxylesterase
MQAVHAQTSVTGDWTGTLSVGTTKLHLVLHITGAPDALHATLDSVDQGANGIPINSITLRDSMLNFAADKIHSSYTGKLSKDGQTLHGTFTQGQGIELDFKRSAKPIVAKAAPPVNRPQNPVPPYPYVSQDVSYTNPLQHDTLAATITIPPGKGPFPAVLLITGSGAQDRDETLMGHKPFLVLSDYLTRHGIVVLRADDRGTAMSTGDFATATTADFATDAEAGVAYLKTRREVDKHRIGLIGHSEGGDIAAMVAARNPDVSYIVMLAGTGVPGTQLVSQQTLLLAEDQGAPAAMAERIAEQEEELLNLAVKEKASPKLADDIRAKLSGVLPDAQVNAAIKTFTTPWYLYFLSYDPAPALRQLKCPVLALNGSKDMQVPPQQNLPAIRKALAGKPNVEIDQMPGLNHLFQTAKTGSPDEYAKINETMSPVVLDKVAVWVLKQP